MKTASIRDLKHETSAVLSWVEQGESVEVRRRNRPVALLSPLPHRRPPELPDYAGRLKRAYGKTKLPVTGTEVVSNGRGES